MVKGTGRVVMTEGSQLIGNDGADRLPIGLIGCGRRSYRDQQSEQQDETQQNGSHDSLLGRACGKQQITNREPAH
jgi:hypothetical protein